MIQQLTTPQQVLPTLAVDSKNRLVAVVVSDDIIGVCMKRIGQEALTQDSYMERLHREAWGTLIRKHDGVFFVTIAGLMPTEDDPRPVLLSRADNMEAVHMAIEIGLSVWPEWGNELRKRFTPKPPLYVHLSRLPGDA